MKKIVYCLLSLALLLPLPVFAHGGVQRTADNVLVTLFQSPISPFVGEQVHFTFVLTDPKTNKSIPQKTARLEITQTTVGDESKDRVVYKKEVTSDVNGDITFTYTFPKTNYYDVELQFGKEHDELTSAGFLVQPRNPVTLQGEIFVWVGGISLLINIALTYFLLHNRKKIMV